MLEDAGLRKLNHPGPQDKKATKETLGEKYRISGSVSNLARLILAGFRGIMLEGCLAPNKKETSALPVPCISLRGWGCKLTKSDSGTNYFTSPRDGISTVCRSGPALSPGGGPWCVAEKSMLGRYRG